MAFFDSDIVQDEAKRLFGDYQQLMQLGSEYGKFDREGKKKFIETMEELMGRYRVFMKRFELSEDFQAKLTVEQLRTQLNQFGITPEQMFEQMNSTLERMKARSNCRPPAETAPAEASRAAPVRSPAHATCVPHAGVHPVPAVAGWRAAWPICSLRGIPATPDQALAARLAAGRPGGPAAAGEIGHRPHRQQHPLWATASCSASCGRFRTRATRRC